MKHIIRITVVALSVVFILNGCKLAGYEFQHNDKYNSSVISPETHMTLWDFMQSRPDLFKSMIEAIEYTGLQDLYKNNTSGNTYLLLTQSALSDVENANSYFRTHQVPNPNYNPADPLQPATMSGFSWEKNYTKEEVSELLKYHIVKGVYNFNQLNATPVWADTYAKGDTCKMSFVLVNDRNATLNIQNNSGLNATTGLWEYAQMTPRTPGLVCTNAPAVHVMDRYIVPPSKSQLGIK